MSKRAKVRYDWAKYLHNMFEGTVPPEVIHRIADDLWSIAERNGIV